MEGAAASRVASIPLEQSPLFVPALWREDHFVVLDETELPDRIAYIEIREPDQAIAAVAQMKTRAFGQVLTLLYAAAMVARASGEREPDRVKSALVELAERFRRVRPTFDFAGVVAAFFSAAGTPPPQAEASRWLAARAVEFADAIVSARARRAALAAELLPPSCRLLTHCNVSGELVAVASQCRRLKKELSVIATETRPYLQGTRLTAWELARAGVDVEIIPDCASAQVIAKGEVDAIVVGADRAAQNGDIVNKVGTFPLAVAANAYGVPFYALVQDPRSLASGDEAEIEERPVEELFTFRGETIAPAGVAASYPAFDVTPAALITRLVGFDGVLTPEEFRRRYQAGDEKPPARKAASRSFVLVYGVPLREGYKHLASVLKAEAAAAVLVPEMRPGLVGARLIARRLAEARIPMVLISDNMMGIFFARGEIRRVLLFCSELTKEGPVGICGFLLAALLARAHRVPVELRAADDGVGGVLDRDAATFLGRPVCPPGARVRPVTQDLVPWRLFHGS
ncbi:MAG TPA: hypothetical protein VNL14_19470 [Candidatus Acidoferrales bacterium]|nr:hypothetical protein [Candidatus Acidoferrales bacterium]